MKRIKSVIAIITLVIFVLGLSGCGLISKTEEGKKKTAIAEVNGEKITIGAYEESLTLIRNQYDNIQPGYFDQNLESFKTQVFKKMIQDEVIMQKAKEDKLVVSDDKIEAEVKKQIADAIKSSGSEKEFIAILAKRNKTKEQYTTQLRDYLKTNMTINNVYENYTKGATVTNKDIIAEYDLNPYKYTEKPNTMNVSHILVSTKAEADKILKEIKAGLDYKAAAKKYGTDGTKDQGGLLGDIEYTTTQYDQDFVKGAIATKTGTVSAPVKTQFGYHLIKVNSRKEYKVKPLKAVEAEIKTELTEKHKEQLFNTALNAWMSVAKIEEYPEEIANVK